MSLRRFQNSTRTTQDQDRDQDRAAGFARKLSKFTRNFRLLTEI